MGRGGLGSEFIPFRVDPFKEGGKRFLLKELKYMETKCLSAKVVSIQNMAAKIIIQSVSILFLPMILVWAQLFKTNDVVS